MNAELYPPIIALPPYVYNPAHGGPAYRYRITLADWHKRPVELANCDVWIYYELKAKDGHKPWTQVKINPLKSDGLQFKVDDLNGNMLDDRFQSDYVYISEPDYQKLCAHP